MPTRITTDAEISLDKGATGYEITGSHLIVVAEVPGLQAAARADHDDRQARVNESCSRGNALRCSMPLVPAAHLMSVPPLYDSEQT